MKKILKKILALSGWELHKTIARKPVHFPTRLESLFTEAKNLGFNPTLIFDIGANHGFWTSKILPIFPQAKFVLFEPQAHCGNDIEKVLQSSPSSRWRKAAVSNKSGKQKFKVAEWDVTSSLLFDEDSNSEFIEVEVTTVDEETSREGRAPDILKIDAEGHDMAVLEGSHGSIGKIEVILVEAGVLCKCENSVGTVIQKMTDLDYRLIGIVDLNPLQRPDGKMNEGRLWLVDLVFARKNGELYKRFATEN
jgi:FkbM family methyltransferase